LIDYFIAGQAALWAAMQRKTNNAGAIWLLEIYSGKNGFFESSAVAGVLIRLPYVHVLYSPSF
jgi:hypothetical protein